LVAVGLGYATGFQLQQPIGASFATAVGMKTPRGDTSTWSATDDEWKGDVVSNAKDGKIRGCTVKSVEDSVIDWIIEIDGEEADLGKFSEVVYRKITADAKQQRFQGFRPGTIPPHLLKTCELRCIAVTSLFASKL
jgi:hypothetical protein